METQTPDFISPSLSHTHTHTHTHNSCHWRLQWPGLLILSIMKRSASG